MSYLGVNKPKPNEPVPAAPDKAQVTMTFGQAKKEITTAQRLKALEAAVKDKKQKERNVAIRLASGNILAARPQERGLFDPARSYPDVVPYWAVKKKAVI